MDPSIWVAIIGAIAGIGTAIGNWVSTSKTNEENKSYATGMTEKTWERDDNSLQRQVADAHAAGLSPLAVTGSMQTSNPLNYVAQAPQMDLSSMIGMLSSFGHDVHSNYSQEKEEEFTSSENEKKMSHELNMQAKELEAMAEKTKSELDFKLSELNKTLAYQYEVLTEQSKAHKQDLESERLINLSNQSHDIYNEICASIGFSPQVEYCDNLEDFRTKLDSFMRSYKGWCEDYLNVYEPTLEAVSENGNTNVSAGAKGANAAIQSSSGSSQSVQGIQDAKNHDAYQYFKDVKFPIFIDNKEWEARTYEYQDQKAS